MWTRALRIAQQSLQRRRQESLRTLNMPRLYLTSYYGGRAKRPLFAGVRTFLAFLGHNRTGGSLVSGLLDAHPNIVLAEEMDSLRYVQAGFSRNQIFSLALENSTRWARQGRLKSGRDGKPYSYLVPGQWHGRFDDLYVIGDHKSRQSTQRLARNPRLLDRLRSTMAGTEVKLIHVTRNPYDTISTTLLRGNYWNLDEAIDSYVGMCGTLGDIWRQTDPTELILVRHEDLIAEPRSEVESLCDFLGVPADDAYLDACASIVYKSPSKSRHAVAWSTTRIAAVREKAIDEFDFLKGYSYEY